MKDKQAFTGGAPQYSCNICEAGIGYDERHAAASRPTRPIRLLTGPTVSGPLANRVKCWQCSDFDLCLKCYHSGAETGRHKKTHIFLIPSELGFVMFEDGWTAFEELVLLEGLDIYNLSWREVSEHVGTRSPEECRSHWTKAYFSSDSSPFPDLDALVGAARVAADTVGGLQLPDDCVPSQDQSGPSVEEIVSVDYPDTFAPRPLMEGEANYNCRRHDFQVEWEDEAELAVRDISLLPTDTPAEREDKLKAVEGYTAIVRERRRLKDFVEKTELMKAKRSHMLFKKAYPTFCEQRRSQVLALRALLQATTLEEYFKLSDGVASEFVMKSDIEVWKSYRECGITTIAETKVYEQEKRKREEAAERRKRDGYVFTEKTPHRIPLKNTPPTKKFRFGDQSSFSVRQLPGVDKLSGTEETLCATIKIPPDVYFATRDWVMWNICKSGVAPSTPPVGLDSKKYSKLGMCAPEDHRILSLPGLTGKPAFAMYSGYVNIDAAHNKNLFYWFVESERDPANDPLVLWMNGGPGASSLIGFFTEHGPFRPDTDGKTLTPNPYSWNKVANVIYVEAPIGVGFSFSDYDSDLTTNDAQTAFDNYRFIVNWLSMFPEFAKHKLYISGESYGGHYVPELAAEILKRDTAGQVPLAGLMIGNPFINADGFLFDRDPYADAWNYVTFMYSHGLLPHQAYANAVARCNWQSYLSNCSSDAWKKPSVACLDAIDICIEYIPRDIDVYDVNSPKCFDKGLQYVSRWSPLANIILNKRAKSPLQDIAFDPCIDNHVVAYMNQESVQKAIHARPTKWDTFAPHLNYSDSDGNDDMIPYFDHFFEAAPHWRILIFSGDLDGCIPFMGTAKWIACRGRPVKNAWRTWHLDGQVAGGVIEYDRITFATVKGAGHMVSYYLPPAGYAIFDRWIQEKQI
eukprot:m51a1_g11859 hypothetical protein (914) ;mRNA; r:503783-507973